VKTKIIKLNPARVGLKKIRAIAREVSAGGVIVYPTDTFYAIGVDCFSAEAVRRVFRLKQRPAGQALPVVVADMDMARAVVSSPPPLFKELASRFWPGPLTLVLKAVDGLPAELVGPGWTIAVRLPAVAWLRKLIRETGSPLTATSANLSGHGEISSAEKAIQVFGNRVDVILDGGETPGGLPSTVLDLTAGRPHLLRAGAFPLQELKRYLS